MRLFTLCAYLKTRNPMIGGLQGEFGDLDIKYLKQNISRCRSEISGSFRRNSVALCKMATKFLQQKDNIFAAQG